VTDPQEQVRQALRDVGQELSKALDQAQKLARQAADDVSKLVGDPPIRRPKRSADAPTELIREIARLRDEGLITEEEYQAKKADLLSRL
jgi:hypothetical protein